MSNRNEQLDNAMNKYNTMNEQLANGSYLKDAIKQAAPLAQTQAAAVGSQTQDAARRAGMSKGRAAMAGQNAAANSYGSSFNNMLGQTYGAKKDSVTNQGQVVNSEMQERQNQHQRFWDGMNAGASVLGGIFAGTSDETAKEAVQTDDEAWNKDSVESFLKKYQKGKSLKDLKWEKKDD